MQPLIETPAGGTEIVPTRRIRSKLFNMGGQKRCWRGRVAVCHYPSDYQLPADGDNLLDVDYEPSFRGNRVPIKAWYEPRMLPGEIGIQYNSGRTGQVTVRYTHANGVPLIFTPPSIRGSGYVWRILWQNVALDLDIAVELRPASIKFLKILKSDLAPKRLESVLSGVQRRGDLIYETGNVTCYGSSRAYDGFDFDGGEIRGRRKAEVSDSDVDLGGGEFRVVHEFTGRTQTQEDAVKRTRVWRTGETIYPVVLNEDIDESIPSNNWDGESFGGNWYANTMYWNGTDLAGDIPGVGFTSIAIGQGDTIDADTNLRAEVLASSATQTPRFFGDDVDSASVWGAGNLPRNITRTTAASANWDLSSVATNVLCDVQAVVQELVDRGGWSSGNNMGFAGETFGATAAAQFQDYNGSVANSMDLEINFTASGGTAAPTSHLLGPLWGPLGGPIA